MRNSQYFGLMCVLSANTAAVVSNGTVRGVFILASAVSVGLSIYYLAKDVGLLDDPKGSSDPVTEPEGGRAAVRGRPARTPGKWSPPRETETGDASLLSDAVIVATPEPNPSPPESAKSPASSPVETRETPASPPHGLPLGGAVVRGEKRQRSITVESPFSWLARALGRGN